MGRHSFNRQVVLHDVVGRIDYITNSSRQEYLYTTYCTVEEEDDGDFWEELAEENQKEFKKYNCAGTCVEAREWIIALEETLVNEDPDTVIRAFTDAFKEKYGVECIAALHHNKARTNYHIHMIFADRKRLAEPVVKIATRKMYYDEHGKHCRTKKEVCDDAGNLRKGCSVIEKGEVYEKTLFTGKEAYFREKAFQDEVKQLFTEINNSFIDDESRKLWVFDRNSVYLATKKIGKNNPKEEMIREDNAVRQEWNRTADRALVSGIQEKEVLKIKKEQILEKTKDSVRKDGWHPEKLTGIIVKATDSLRGMIRVATIPKKPKLTVDIKEFRDMAKVKESLDVTSLQIKKLEKRIKAKEDYIDKLTYPWKKLKALKELSELVNRRSELESNLQKIVKEAGYPSVQRFMKAYQKSEAAIRKYEKEYAVYQDAVEKGLVVDPDVKVSIAAKLQKYQKEAKEAERGKTQTKDQMRDVNRKRREESR